MATIDYKEKYEQALEVAQRFYNNSVTITKKGLEDIFPELAGSEDEKIRKELIAEVKEQIDCIPAPDCRDKEDEKALKQLNRWIAWLEKQGKKDEEILILKDQIESLQAAIKAIKETHRIELEKQGEQKPTEWSNICEFSLKTWINIVCYVLKEHNGIGNYLDDPEVKDTAEKLQKKYKFDSASEEWDRVYRRGLDAGEIYGRNKALKEQNSSWSEEDKSYLLDFTRWFEQKAKAYDINLPMRGFDICAFCKEIIERLRICENLVWENIDETQRTNAIIMLKEGARRVYSKDSIDKCADWLKSLRPQSQWKPSEEQMRVLDLAIRCGINRGTTEETTLVSLFNNLKKLREE